MNIFIFLILFGLTQLVTSSMLKCGEEIRVNRGEKKTLRFWSTDDELLRVEMVPNRGESDASALLAMFKNSYNKGSDIFGSRDEPLKFKSSLGTKNDDQESLYRIDEKIIENFNNFSSETKPPQYYADNETQTTSSPVSQKDEEIQTTIYSVSQKEEEIQTTISSVRQKDEETQTIRSSVNQRDEETQTTISSVSQKYEETQTISSSVSHKDEETQTASSSVSQKDEETQTTIPSVSQKDEDYDKNLDRNEENINQALVETKSEHIDENANEIPDKEWDIETSTQMSITPEEETEHLKEQISHVNKEDVPSNEFSVTEEITTEGYQDLQVLDFSYESEIEESESSTENKIKANIQGQNHEEVNEVTNYYKFTEETTMTQDMDERVTPLPEIDIRVNNDLTTIPVTEQTTSIYLHEISDSSTDLPLEEKYEDNLRTDISVESLYEPVAYEDKDIMDTTESFEDKTASHMNEDPSTTIISEVESTTLPTSLDYKLKEESTETDPKTDSNDDTPSIETRTENLEIYSTEPVQGFTTQSETIKVSSDDISSPEDTTELKTFENDHTESSITTDLTSESAAAKEQFDEKITMIEMENTPEIYIEEGDLEDIISELKSQEALLKLPSVGDNLQNRGTVSDSNDAESIDLKLSILKNIIKEITSEIEAKEKQKTEIDDSRNHIYLPYSEEETFVGNEEQNNERQSVEKVKSGKIHVEESSSISSLRKHLLEKASKADLSTTNEIILPNIFNSASSVNQQKENSTQNTAEEDNSDVDIDLDLQLTTVSTVESETSKISNEDGKMEEREEPKNTKSESTNHNTNFPSHEELVIPLNLLKIFNDNDTEKTSENRPKELANSDLKSQTSSLSNDQDSLNKENTLNFQETSSFKSMRKEGINLNEKITTSSSTIEDETSKIDDNDEQVQVSNSNNSATFGKETESDVFGKETGSDIFGKETGSDKVLSLIKKGEKGIIEFTKHGHEGENNIFLPSQVLSPKQNPSQTLAAAENDNKVEIKEPGSKVVIIKPNSDILKAKKESDSLALNTENGNYEVEIESTTSQQFISEENPESVSETLDASNPNSENLITNKSMSEEESEITTLGQEMEKSTTESYIPFGLVKEKYNTETDEIQNESLIKSKVDTVNAVANEAEASDGKPDDMDNISDNENPSPSSDTFSADLLKSDTSENTEAEIFDALVNEDEESQSYYNDETFDYDAAYPQKENLQRKIDTDIHEEKPPQNYLYNHRIEENPLPYVLQTRKGLVEVDPIVSTPIRTGGIQNRKDDSQQTFGKDSPFYIKLPGTQDMVPVFLQYEPVKVKYVNAEKFFQKKPGNAIDKTQTIEKGSNDVSSSSPKKILKTKNKDKYNPEVDVSKIPDYLNVDFHLRPDPFYVMDPPNLANKVNKNVEEETNEVETMSLNVEGKLSFNKQQNTPNSMKEDKPVYPGEYFIKNPDNSYSSSDTSSLTNPVFSLGSKVTLPPRESVNLQYTPFPLTTNPPKKQTPEDTENEIEVASISPLPLYSPTAKTTTFITSDASSNSTENTPSIEYSPIPSIDYPDSYGPFEFPDIPFVENNEDLLFDNTPDSLSDTYPEKATFITGIKNEKFIDEPLKKNNDFDIVALANFLHQNQKVWSTPKVTPNPETNSWRNPSWDDVIRSAEEPEKPRSDRNRNSGPWVERRRERGEERFYSAFRSPEEVPGLDPAFFSYRKMPADIKEKEPLKDSNLSVEKRSSSNVDGIMRYIENLPLIMQKAVMNPKSNIFGRRAKRSSAPAGEHVYCEWNIKTEPGLYLLVTFHNLSAPYTVDCYGAYIEVERENNGYDARWCGNRATVPGARPHVIFAKSEVRITLYDNGDAAKTYPTGFEAEIEVIDLFDTEEYKHFIEKKATPKIRRLMEG